MDRPGGFVTCLDVSQRTNTFECEFEFRSSRHLASESYPVKTYENYPQKALGGHDIYRSANRWIALVVVETERRKELRLYAWRKRGDDWKVDLASLNVGFWDFQAIREKAEELKHNHNIAK